jgi:hypothetical protein
MAAERRGEKLDGCLRRHGSARSRYAPVPVSRKQLDLTVHPNRHGCSNRASPQHAIWRGGRIFSVAAIIAVEVNADGRREVLGMEVGTSVAEPIWTEFLRKLRRARVSRGGSGRLLLARCCGSTAVAAMLRAGIRGGVGRLRRTHMASRSRSSWRSRSGPFRCYAGSHEPSSFANPSNIAWGSGRAHRESSCKGGAGQSADLGELGYRPWTPGVLVYHLQRRFQPGISRRSAPAGRGGALAENGTDGKNQKYIQEPDRPGRTCGYL